MAGVRSRPKLIPISAPSHPNFIPISVNQLVGDLAAIVSGAPSHVGRDSEHHTKDVITRFRDLDVKPYIESKDLQYFDAKPYIEPKKELYLLRLNIWFSVEVLYLRFNIWFNVDVAEAGKNILHPLEAGEEIQLVFRLLPKFLSDPTLPKKLYQKLILGYSRTSTASPSQMEPEIKKRKGHAAVDSPAKRFQRDSEVYHLMSDFLMQEDPDLKCSSPVKFYEFLSDSQKAVLPMVEKLIDYHGIMDLQLNPQLIMSLLLQTAQLCTYLEVVGSAAGEIIINLPDQQDIRTESEVELGRIWCQFAKTAQAQSVLRRLLYGANQGLLADASSIHRRLTYLGTTLHDLMDMAGDALTEFSRDRLDVGQSIT